MYPVSINLGGYQPPTSVHNRAAEVIGQELEKRVGNAVDYRLEGNMTKSRGIKAFDLPGLVEAGDLEMCYFASSYLAKRVPEVAIFDLPFVVQSREKAYAALDGELGVLLKEKFVTAMGVRILGFWDNGFRHFTNGVRQIRLPADCMDLKMRSMNSDVHQDFFRLLGFDPIYVDVADLVEKVKSGEIDAQENPLTNTYHFGTYQYHQHITLTGHFFGMSLLMVNEKIFNAWPADIQEAVQASVNVATGVQRGFAQAEDDEVLAILAATDNALVVLSDEERKAFKEAVQPLVSKHRARLGDRLFELVE
jgi:TRAP-type C4-dicarboxylate transport system substrate-binding protein